MSQREVDNITWGIALGALLLGGTVVAAAIAGRSSLTRLNALQAAGVDCSKLQGWLYDYLKQDVDPYDFQFMVSEWVEEHPDEAETEQYDLDTMYESLTDEHQSAFVEWLKSGKLDDLRREDPYNAPAYLALRAYDMLPAGTWLVHFTREPSFDAFDRGTTIEGMHLSVWNSQKTFADCASNLSEDVGLTEVVFGFAFEADAVPEHYVASYARKYGQNVVLFQCDCAVRAYHDGDQEFQAIFPICSEYNVVHLSGDGYGGFSRGRVSDGDEVEFPSLAAALSYAKSR